MRLYLATMWLAAAAYAGPSLTTIQDVLYKADGTKFNGVLTIAWNSFQSVDNSAIVMQSTTVKVVDGNLRVQLVPSTSGTPASFYTVTYNSDGRVQFQERWSVPSSGTALRVRDVRVASSSTTTPGAGGQTANPIYETDVVGLIADLGARPQKAATFAFGKVAMINSSGLLESVSGSPEDCVRVDGTAGPCGSSSSPVGFVDGEAPAGIVDGANAAFTVAGAPEPTSSLAVYRNGLLQKIDQDYTLSGRAIQFVAAAVPQPGDTLLVSYRMGTAESGSLMYPSSQVLCNGVGATTDSTSLAALGSCSIAAGMLTPGDRVEARYDFEHSGGLGGFSFEVRWGNTVVGRRDADAADILATGRADAALVVGGARLSAQSWGTVLPLGATVATSSDAYASGLTITFAGKVNNAPDTLALRNFTVTRYR